jgi:MFS family permease
VAPPLEDLAGGNGREQRGWRRTFAALSYPAYRLWFVGQLVSLVGSWMQVTAQGYLVFELTRSPAYLGYVAFATGAPAWLLMLYGGVVADRVPRRRLLLVAQGAMMALALALAALTLSGAIRPFHLILLGLGMGLVTAFEAPARHAFVPELVGRADLTNAIALNSTMFNGAIAVGPAIAGVLYAALGPGACFLINAASYLAVIGALALMKLAPISAAPRRTSPLADLKEGLRYVARHRDIRALIVLLGGTTIFGLSFATLLPAWAVTVLGGDATTNGWLQSARGVGAVLGALVIASLGRFEYRGKLLSLGTVVLPVALLLFSQVRLVPLAIAALVGVGVGLTLIFNLLNSMVQALASDELRGRVMGIYSLTFFGITPLAGLAAGGLAERIGEPLTVVLGAGATLALAVVVWLALPRLRRL